MGTHGIEHRTGWVADYCQICRDVQPHAVVLDAPAQSGLDDPIVECAGCTLRTRVPALRYLSVVTRRPDAVSELLARTFPRLPLAIADRVRWEKRAIEGRLAAPERLEAIREPFLLIEPPAAVSGWSIGLHVIAGAAVSYIVLSGSVQGLFGSAAVNSGTRTMLFLFSVAIGGLIGWRGYGGFAWSNRLQMLARSLRPLRPSRDELESTLAWARGMRIWFGAKYSARQVERALARRPDRSLVHVDELRLLELADAMSQETAHANGASEESDDESSWDPRINPGS